jgi:hypothetical protein
MIIDERWSRALVIVGLVAMVAGALDPLEGSIMILAGVACLAIGTSLLHSRHAPLLRWSAALVCLGVATLWILSDRGGFGGVTGRSNWWALTLLPYPVGWVLGMVGAYRHLREAYPRNHRVV